MANKVRVRRSDRKRLKALQETEIVQEQTDDETPNYEQTLKTILPEPEDDTIISLPEKDMVWVDGTGEMRKRLKELAGENVSIHQVVNHYIEQFEEENDLDLDIDA